MRCLVLFSIISLLLAGCAGTQVHSMATGSAASAAYELKGRSLFVLERQRHIATGGQVAWVA